MIEDKIILAQDNKLTLSRQNFTTIEKRCLYFIIKEVQQSAEIDTVAKSLPHLLPLSPISYV